MLDFSLVRSKLVTFEALCNGLSPADLHQLTDEMVDKMLDLISEAVDEDVVFLPLDPNAYDKYAADLNQVHQAWTLGHVIVHTTASAEEAAAIAANLARGVPVDIRLRYETPWETITMVEHMHQRLEESRRIRHAFLDTWPDQPNLEVTYTPGYLGAQSRHAIQQFVSGLAHDDAHLGRIAEIMRQAKAARI